VAFKEFFEKANSFLFWFINPFAEANGNSERMKQNIFIESVLERILIIVSFSKELIQNKIAVGFIQASNKE